MAQSDEFLDQIVNDILGTTIVLRRNSDPGGSDLRDFHVSILIRVCSPIKPLPGLHKRAWVVTRLKPTAPLYRIRGTSVFRNKQAFDFIMVYIRKGLCEQAFQRATASI